MNVGRAWKLQGDNSVDGREKEYMIGADVGDGRACKVNGRNGSEGRRDAPAVPEAW